MNPRILGQNSGDSMYLQGKSTLIGISINALVLTKWQTVVHGPDVKLAIKV